MRKWVLISAVLLPACLFALGASQWPQATEVPDNELTAFPCQMICLDENDNGETINLRNGSFLHVNLVANLSTGYYWYLEELDQDIVAHYCETCVPIPPEMLGSPCDSKWFFQAKNEGETVLVLKYYRIWEGPAQAIKTFRVRLVVQ